MKLGTLRSAIRSHRGDITFKVEVPGRTNSNGLNVGGAATMMLALTKGVLMDEITRVHGPSKAAETGLMLTASGVFMSESAAVGYGETPADPDLCDDEGCPQSATPHVCRTPAPAPVNHTSNLDDLEDLLG